MDTTEGPTDTRAFTQHFVNDAFSTRKGPAPRKSPSLRAPLCTASGFGSDIVSDNKIVVQNARGLEEDSGLTNHTGSGGQESFHLPTQLRLPPEVDFTLPSPGSTADSEWTDRTDLGGAPRTAPTRPVPQAVRAGPTASVPDNARPRCLAAPTSGEIRSHLTFLDEFSTPRDTDVTVACAPSASALPSGASTDSRQGRTEDEDCQVRVKHVTYCCICGRWPGDPQDDTPTNVEAVFCRTCPRKFCLSCLNLSQTADTLGWERRFDSYGDFRRTPDGCTSCRRGTDREVPADIGESHGAAITEVLKDMLQWLGNHDLARFFREDVNLLQFPKYKRRVRKPMSLAKIRDQLEEGYYAITTEAGMRRFLQDISLIESNCIRFNGKKPGISRSAATLSSRFYLFYQSHIEPLAAKLGFPHMLGEKCTYDGRIRITQSVKAAGRRGGDQNSGIDGSSGGTGDSEITGSPRASVAPPTSSPPNLTESSDRVSSSPLAQTQSARILSPSAFASFRGANADSCSSVDPSADPVTADIDQDDSVAFRSARAILVHGEGVIPMHGEMAIACPKPPRKISKSGQMNDARNPCHQLGSHVAETGHSSGGVSRDSPASCDDVRITTSSGRLRSTAIRRVHTNLDEATSARKPSGVSIRREERAEQHGNGDQPVCQGSSIRETERTLSSWTLQQAEAVSSSVRQEASAILAAAEGAERPTTPEVSTAALTAGSTRLEPHFETDRSQSGAAVRERFSEGQVVWVFHCFAADMPLDGWVEEEMHVPGIITARDETFGASPAMFTIDLFGREPAVLQEIADNLSLFPMERGLDSARSAVTHGLRPERAGGINYLNMVVAQAMMTCIDSGWNSTTGTNIYHRSPPLDASCFYRRTREYSDTWGVDSVKLAMLMCDAVHAMGQHEATFDVCISGISGGDSHVLGAGRSDGIGDADPSVGGPGGDGDNSVHGVPGGFGAAADDAGGESWTQPGSQSSPSRQSGLQDTSTTYPSALQASVDDMLVDGASSCNNSNALNSSVEEKTESPARSPPSDGTATLTAADEHITLPPYRNCFDTPPLFNEIDFEDWSMDPGTSNEASLSDCRSLRGR